MMAVHFISRFLKTKVPDTFYTFYPPISRVRSPPERTRYGRVPVNYKGNREKRYLTPFLLADTVSCLLTPFLADTVS